MILLVTVEVERIVLLLRVVVKVIGLVTLFVVSSDVNVNVSVNAYVYVMEIEI